MKSEKRVPKKLRSEPSPAEVNVLVALFNTRQYEKTQHLTQALLEQYPDFIFGWKLLIRTLLMQNKEALPAFQKIAELSPNDAEAHFNLGVILKNSGRFDSAALSYRRAIELKPDFSEAYSNLGTALKDLGHLDDAIASYRRAVDCKTDNILAYNNLGNLLADIGQHIAAQECYRQVLAVNPDFAEGWSNLLFSLSQCETVDAPTLFAEHCRFAGQFEEPLRSHWPQHANSKDPERCLQIGFVSGDLRDHAVAHFIEPVLAHLSSYPQLSLHAYSNHTIEDAVTQRVREHLTHWHSIAGLSDDVLAQKIRQDGIDILIDLSGHTAHHRLLTFARKPAPIQVSWIGYPGTTGLSAMDYYLADRFFLPPGQLDEQFTEKIVCLPAIAPFLSYRGAPPVSTLPALHNGFVTFGSFNRPCKLGPSVISLWSRLLRALPDSRMLLGAMPQGDHRKLIELFAQAGIARERLDLHIRSNMESYLSLHQQVDICLDTFPYNGGTTTCHALWMGVPTLTITGSTPASRVGATILSHAELSEFVGVDAADFVQKGVSQAQNFAGLSNVRAELRERFSNSAMGQPAVVAAGVERVLRIMWRRWCGSLPTRSFEV